MAVLIFGVATAPVFSNGLAYAQSDDTKYTEKEKKEQRSDESKQRKVQQQADAEERKQVSKEKHTEDSEKKEQKRNEQQEKRTAAQELQEQRRAELAEKNQALMDRLAAKVQASEERMQDRIDNMQTRSPMSEAIDRLNQANSPCGPGTSFNTETNSCVLDVIDSSDVSADTIGYSGNVASPGSLTLDKVLDKQRRDISQTGTYFDKLRDTISEQKRSQDMLFSQIALLLNLVDSMCEDKVIVTGISDGKLRCIDSDRAFNMHSRGLVTLVE